MKTYQVRQVHRGTAIVILLIASLFGTVPGFSAGSKTKTAKTYTVRKGDNLSKIAKSFGTTPETLKEINGLKNNKLSIGQVLQLTQAPATQAKQGGEAARSAAATAAENAPLSSPLLTPPEQQTYTVRQGDNLYQIAKTFDLDVKELKAANKLSSNNLKIGQTLVLPAEPPIAQIAVAAVVSPAAPNASNTQNALNVTPVAKTSISAVVAKPEAAKAIVAEDLSLRDRLVQAGFQMLGVRYRFGGTSEKTGLDCSALVKNIFAKFDLTLPRSSREQYKEGEKVAREDLQKGDLVFFSSSGKTPTHVGIYIGDNQFLHAARKAKKVTVSDLNKTWYNLRYLGARRIMGLWWEDLETPDSEQPEIEEPVDFKTTTTTAAN
ncbi:MAG: LysM peptidoglycan-binding domain-containing protein [Acidobacteriota bacterium]|jgi:cell wall-associated NlpC family hydrolase|nr:LysM peptidoglycan-binding domain-containing protein [Acidobacteriota bacterium]